MDDARPEAERPDPARLSPGEIAYRDFGREHDGGLKEQEVRVFLSEVADLVAEARKREQQLEERVRELEARLAGSAPGDAASSAPDPRVDAVFARLREASEEPVAKPEPSEPPPVSAPGASTPSGEDQPAVESPDTPLEPKEPPAPEPTADDRLRARRDVLLEPLVADLLRGAKRLLQDEQNLLLDAARRARSRVDPARLLPDPVHHRDAWVALLSPALDIAYGGGRTAVARSRRSPNAPERVVKEIAADLIGPLRERLTTTAAAVVAEGPYESPAELHREMVSAIGARYREWRGPELEMRLGDGLAAAYARGAYDGAPSGSHLHWVTDAAQRCPDCDDNSLEPTLKGQCFPTGQPHPPAHPGCRCLVVPTEERGRVSGASDN